MAVDHIRYDLLTQDAMRDVVRRVLEDAAKNGVPGDHHFYVSFDPRAEGVQLSQRMREQYPEEMTIVLQHQYWDLTVTDERFQVGLSFGGVAELVVVPFVAIKGFFDPSVQFGVQFEQSTEAETAEDGQPGKSDAKASTRPAAEHRRRTPDVTVLPTPANSSPPPQPAPGAPAGGGEVVRLDRFRKK
jgi:hypothetical protein